MLFAIPALLIALVSNVAAAPPGLDRTTFDRSIKTHGFPFSTAHSETPHSRRPHRPTHTCSEVSESECIATSLKWHMSRDASHQPTDISAHSRPTSEASAWPECRPGFFRKCHPTSSKVHPRLDAGQDGHFSGSLKPTEHSWSRGSYSHSRPAEFHSHSRPTEFHSHSRPTEFHSHSRPTDFHLPTGAHSRSFHTHYDREVPEPTVTDIGLYGITSWSTAHPSDVTLDPEGTPVLRTKTNSISTRICQHLPTESGSGLMVTDVSPSSCPSGYHQIPKAHKGLCLSPTGSFSAHHPMWTGSVSGIPHFSGNPGKRSIGDGLAKIEDVLPRTEDETGIMVDRDDEIEDVTTPLPVDHVCPPGYTHPNGLSGECVLCQPGQCKSSKERSLHPAEEHDGEVVPEGPNQTCPEGYAHHKHDGPNRCVMCKEGKCHQKGADHDHRSSEKRDDGSDSASCDKTLKCPSRHIAVSKSDGKCHCEAESTPSPQEREAKPPTTNPCEHHKCETGFMNVREGEHKCSCQPIFTLSKREADMKLNPCKSMQCVSGHHGIHDGREKCHCVPIFPMEGRDEPPMWCPPENATTTAAPATATPYSSE